jgi:hypothetical protein
MSVPKISRAVQAEKAQTEKLGATIDSGDKREIETLLALKEVEEKLEAEAKAVPKDPDLILQEIKIDRHNLKREYVKLTPSMCRHRNCGYDSAKEFKISGGWDNAPLDMKTNNGQTVAERLVGMREFHEANAHLYQQNDHLVSSEDLKNRSNWTPGQTMNTKFL